MFGCGVGLYIPRNLENVMAKGLMKMNLNKKITAM
jgi:hypothetical protein